MTLMLTNGDGIHCLSVLIAMFTSMLLAMSVPSYQNGYMMAKNQWLVATLVLPLKLVIDIIFMCCEPEKPKFDEVRRKIVTN